MTSGAAAIRGGEAGAAAPPRAGEWHWGWFPVLSLVVAGGIFLVAAGNRAGLGGAWWADPLLFSGLLVIALPIGLRLLSTGAHGTERVSLVALLAIGLYLFKFLRDPIRFGGFDEFLHLATAQDILATGRLFEPNPLLTVSPYYPGLELVAAAISSTGETSVFGAGVILLAAARLVFLLSFFFFFAMATSSARVAGIACVIYMANPRFLYFDAQFAYESLALPLAAFVLYLLARRAHSEAARWAGLTVVMLVTLPAIVATHHVTSALLGAFLLLWAAVGLAIGRRDRARPGTVAVIAVVLVVVWTAFVATPTIDYLLPVMTTAGGELVRLLSGELDPRQLFVSRAGAVAPAFERLLGSASAAVVLLLLPLGLLTVWTRHRTTPVVVALSVVALAYPLSLIGRFTPVGAEVASRTPEFLFMGVGVVIALGLARFSYRGRFSGLQIAFAGSAMAVLFAGGVLVGMPAWARLPGPYLVSADSRSIEPEGLAAAAWTREALGPDNRFVADRVNRILLSAYGGQQLVTSFESGLAVRRLYLAREFEDVHYEIIRAGNIHYLVADRRLTTALPTVGHYFDRGEEAIIGQRRTPLEAELLDKFDRMPGVSRVFDSGNIRIYDISALGASR